jgi:hypothetical protein
MRMCENRLLRRIFGVRRVEETEEWKKNIVRSPVICTAQ